MNERCPIVYLAEPIDHAPRRFGVSVFEWLQVAKCTVYSPRSAWGVVGAPRREIQQVNRAALARSQGLLAIIPDHVPSIGVPMEIYHAQQLGIPIAILCGQQSWALAIYERIERIEQFKLDEAKAAVDWLVLAVADRPVAQGRRRALVAGDGQLPTQTYPDDVGWDLYHSGAGSVWLEPGEAADVPCGVEIEWPEGMWALVVGRSSTFRRRLLCNVGVIDPGYRGEYFAVLHNIGREKVEIRPGERVAQVIPMYKDGWGIEMAAVHDLSPTDRGERGFGSSGQ